MGTESGHHTSGEQWLMGTERGQLSLILEVTRLRITEGQRASVLLIHFMIDV